MNERELFQAILEKHPSLIEEIRADERRKLAEWLKNNNFYIVEWGPEEKYSVNRGIETAFIKYEKEKKNEQT